MIALHVALACSLIAYFSGRAEAPAEAGYAARMTTIADALVEACEREPIPGWSTLECVALSETLTQWESGLRKDVHEGRRHGPGGARCLFQLEPSIHQVPDPRWRVTLDEWFHTVGLSHAATLRCARAGVRVLGWHAYRCGIRSDKVRAPERLIAEYKWADVDCEAPISEMSRSRARTYRSLVRKFQEATQ